MKPGGSKPSPRSGMSCAVAANGKAYVFGGVLDTKEDEEDLEGQFGNDLHMLDVSSLVWRRIELAKAKKKQEKESSANVEKMEAEAPQTVTTDGIFTVTVGGPKAASSASESLKESIQNAGFPAPRSNAGVAICKGILYIFGGMYEQGHRQYTLSDFYSLDSHKLDAFKTLIANSNTQEWLGSDSEDESDSDDSQLSDDDEDDDEDDDSEEEESDEMDTD